jgi:PAS domain-containing protein
MRSLRARLATAVAAVLLASLAAALLSGRLPAAELLHLTAPLGLVAAGALVLALLACGIAVAGALVAFGRAQRQEGAAAQARDELERERSRLDAVLRLLPAGVLVADASGKLLQANEEARRIWGGRSRNGAPATYRTCRARRPGTGEPIETGDWGVQRALRTGEAGPLELIEIDRFDGTRAQVLSGSAPVRGRDGALIGAVAVLQDVAGLRRAAAWSSEATLRPGACDPHDLLADAAELLRAHVQGLGLELSVAAEPGLPWVSCDREQVVHALVGLAATAAASASGALHLEARLRGGVVLFRIHGGEPRTAAGGELTFSLPGARAAVPLAPPGSPALRPSPAAAGQGSSAGSTGTREPARASRPGRWPSKLP